MADEPKAKSLLAVLKGVVDRHVKQRPRDALVRNAVDDPAEPLAQRVTESDACDFCSRFANDKPVNPSKVSEHFHQFCKCHFALFFQETKYRERFANDKELERIGVTMEEGAAPDYYEKRDSMVLAALGHKVKFLKRHPSGARRADTLVDGELVEFKNPEGNGLFTVMYQIQGNLHGKNKSVIKAQSDVLLVSNVRNSMTMLDMEMSLAFAFGPDSKLTQTEKAYMRKIILLDERTRRVRTYEMKEAGVARLLGPRRRQENDSIIGRLKQAKRPDVPPVYSLSAAAKPDRVKIPKKLTGLSEDIYVHRVMEKPITGVYAMFGKGTPYKIKDEMGALKEQYPDIPESEWTKYAGNGYVKDMGLERKAHLHWCECEEIGKTRMKVDHFLR